MNDTIIHVNTTKLGNQTISIETDSHFQLAYFTLHPNMKNGDDVQCEIFGEPHCFIYHKDILKTVLKVVAKELEQISYHTGKLRKVLNKTNGK